MKSAKLKAFFLTLALAVSLLAGCGAQDSPQPPGPSATPEATGAAQTEAPSSAPTEAPRLSAVTDMTDRVVELPEKIGRIVALAAADCEILYALGAGDLLVGRGEYCNWPQEILDLPSVQSGNETNAEQVLALEPDVLIMSKMDQSADQVAMFENAGIAVVVTDAQNINGVYDAISLIGSIAGKSGEANALADGMKDALDELVAKIPQKGGGTVYFEVSPLEWGLWTAGAGTFMDEIASMLGLTNIFADVDGWAEISQEQVIERDPDYIVTIAMFFGDGPTPDEEIMSRDGWQGMKAIKSGNVLLMDSDEISRPGPRLALAAETLYNYVYGG